MTMAEGDPRDEARAPAAIHARCDAAGRLLTADEPLAGLQRRCGGEIPGTIAIPALLSLARRAQVAGVPVAGEVHARDADHALSMWVEAAPDGDGGCALVLDAWRAAPLVDEGESPEGEAELARLMAGCWVLLDAEQRVLAAVAGEPRFEPLAQALAAGRGQPWTDCVGLPGSAHRQPLHWRLLDGAHGAAAGIEGPLRVRLFPRPAGPSGSAGSAGFELCLIGPAIAAAPASADPAGEGETDSRAGEGALDGLLGRELAPALRQPAARILAAAETIRARLAGPLADGYAGYAGDIVEAGRHLAALIDDLAELEAIDDPHFAPECEPIDLADCARRAAGLLGVRARERSMTLEVPATGERVPATGDFRRVLQILLNLIGNALRYAPEATTVTLTAGSDEGAAWVAVADEGDQLAPEHAERVFVKLERLGRSGDGGSGLGLYIARRLARAMGGDLTLDAHPGAGARFVLTLPEGA